MPFVQDYQPHFTRSYFDITPKKKKTQYKKNKLSQEFDKLFFHFLVILKYDMPMIYNKHEETLIKYNIVQNMEQFKFKNKDNICNHICYEECINLRCLACLSSFFKVNIVFYYGNVMIQMIDNEEGPLYWINEKKEIVSLKRDKYEEWLQEDTYIIRDVSKPLFSMSHYKLDDLKELTKQLKLCIDDSNTWKKKDYYENIEEYLGRVLF